jgi:pimeloyl-ACP methyl ester carboxylesterase
MTEIAHRFVQTNRIRLHLVEQGSGPLVLLCHGFPESSYSWRHQLPALAAAGYRAVAPDMRGYGRSDRPPDIEKYTQLHLVGDMVGVLDALGAGTAVIVGHDWGAPVAWNGALMRPDRFRAVAALSVPYAPRGSARPTAAMAQASGDRFNYILYFQPPGVAEAELERDVRGSLRRFVYTICGDAPPEHRWRVGPRNSKLLDGTTDPERLPPWLTEEDLAFYADEFSGAGFRGGLNRYRAIDLTWELMAPFHHARVTVPALFIGGDRDPVIAWRKSDLDRLPETVPGLRKRVLLSGCGHWTQQERPAEVNAELIAFLNELDT